MNFDSYMQLFESLCPFKIVHQFQNQYYKDETINDSFDGINLHESESGTLTNLEFTFKIVLQQGVDLTATQVAERVRASVVDQTFYRLFRAFDKLASERTTPKPAPKVNSIDEFLDLFNSLSTGDSPESRALMPATWFSQFLRRTKSLSHLDALKENSKKNMRTSIAFGPPIINPPSSLVSRVTVFSYEYSLVVGRPQFTLNGNDIAIKVGYDIQHNSEICVYNI